MIKNIIKDTFFLSLPSSDFTENDIRTITDLKDTLRFHSSHCLGMAANMIGVNRKIIAINMGFDILIMINPVILNKNGVYDTFEGCLSLSGERNTKRYKNIKVEFLDEHLKKQVKEFSGIVAQAIQHEIDHLSGIII